MRAAMLAGGRQAYGSHRGACATYGVMPESVAEVTVPFKSDLVLADGVVHRSRRPLAKTRVLDGIRVCSVERALLDAASVCSELEVETAVEAALLKRLTTEERLWTALIAEGGRGVPGSARFRKVLENRPRGRPARSVLEVLTGRLLRKNGVTGFVRNFRVTGLDGTSFEIDFAFVDQMVALEVDGKAFHSTRTQTAKDRKRQKRLEALGWRFVRVGWHDVVLRPNWVLEQLALAFEANCALLST